MYIVNQTRTGIINTDTSFEIYIDNYEKFSCIKVKNGTPLGSWLGEYSNRRANEVFEQMLKDCFPAQLIEVVNDDVTNRKVYYMPEV